MENQTEKSEIKNVPVKSDEKAKKKGKPRNVLKDPKVLKDIEDLFDDLKGSKEDDYVDSSTVLYVLNMFEVSKTEPEYFWYVYT